MRAGRGPLEPQGSFRGCAALRAEKLSQSGRAESLLLRNRARRFVSRCSSCVWHSQTISTRQPARRRAAAVRRSRATFASNLCDQKRTRDFGWYDSLQPAWRCQKQPCTNTMTLRRGSTKSGEPGNLRSCSRNRYPSRWTQERTTNSGAVSLERIRLIRSLRSRLLILSATTVTSTAVVGPRRRCQRSLSRATAARHCRPAGTARYGDLQRSSCPGTSECVPPHGRSCSGTAMDRSG